MLPISVFYPQKHQVDKLNEDVLLDIMTTKHIINDGGSISETRIKSSHGMAMGLLHPSLDSGKSSGFGMFRGEKIHGYEEGTGKPKYNIFLIGYAWNVDFASVLANGLAATSIK